MSKHTRALLPRPADATSESTSIVPQYRNTRKMDADAAGANVNNVLQAPGRPLDAATRAFMEPRIGYDLSAVRVHTDAQAGQSAQAIQARAYTAGHNVVFGTGQYVPGTSSGHHLLAHELTHVVQQASGPVAGTRISDNLSISHPSDPFEQHARVNAAQIIAGRRDGLSAAGTLAPLPALHTSGQTSVQRDGPGGTGGAAAPAAPTASGGGDTAGSIIGATAGVAGALFALSSVLIARAPTSATGGVNITHAQFNTLDRQAAGSTEASMASPTEVSKKILKVSAGSDDYATISLILKHDNHNIIDAYTQEDEVKGYAGGTGGTNASINFTTMQTRPLQAIRPAGAGDTNTPTTITNSEVELRFTGINSAPAGFLGSFVGGSGTVQRFRGALKVRGNGEIVGDNCTVTQGSPNDKRVNGGQEPCIEVGLNLTPVAPAPRAAPTPAPSAAPGAPPLPGTLNDRLDNRFTGRGTG